MTKKLCSGAVGVALMVSSAADCAVGTAYAPDASLILFEVNASGRVNFRNLNEFNSLWAGCCTSFWMDISTDVGKAQYATFLTAYYSKRGIKFYADSDGGTFFHVGMF
jgi:hypothetical protein